MKITKSQLRRIIKEEAARLIAEEEDQNKDGENDFSDVKIARMKASGMSDEEIKKKHPELFEADGKHPKEYSPKEKSIRGMTRGEAFDKTQEDLASGDPEREARAWRRREAMEKKANEGRSYAAESYIRGLVSTLLREELSKTTEDKIRKIAKERGMTFGSMKKEFKKGLAAWGTSGSKTGVSQHAWAFARIKKANPSDDWSVVKKSKAQD